MRAQLPKPVSANSHMAVFGSARIRLRGSMFGCGKGDLRGWKLRLPLVRFTI